MTCILKEVSSIGGYCVECVILRMIIDLVDRVTEFS